MTDWYAPNQQAVGVEPAAATAEPTKTEAKAEPAKSTAKTTSKAKSED